MSNIMRFHRELKHDSDGTYFQYFDKPSLFISIRSDGSFNTIQEQHEFWSYSLETVEEWLWHVSAISMLEQEITSTQQECYNELKDWMDNAYRTQIGVVYETLFNEMQERVKKNPLLDLDFYNATIVELKENNNA